MSGEDNSTNNNTDMMTAILEAINNCKNESNDKFKIINDKFESMQAENAATREELISRIDKRSRVSTRAPSRATSPRQLATRLEELNMKMPELEPVVKMPLETPRPVYSGVVYTEPRLTMTEIFKDKQAADDFEEQNKLRDKRKPAVNKHDNTISSRETFAAINRPGNPVMKETFTRTTPDNKARLSSPLTLETHFREKHAGLPAKVQRGGSVYQLRGRRSQVRDQSTIRAHRQQLLRAVPARAPPLFI